mmetsp:Transcript_34450/g.77683  ORF Transcript_34450/g.77683 Transcript_34450/m.77683 type:complete len:362 (-) Transcript_34450:105-1190(-)
MLGLRNNADLRPVIWVCKYYLISYLAWTYEDYFRHSYLLSFLTLLVISYYSFAGATITHNTMHSKVFHNKWANRIWQVLLSLTYGHPVSSFVPGHNLSHHRYTQLPQDPMRTSKLRFRWNFLNGLLFQPIVAGDVFKADVRYINMQSKINTARAQEFYTNCMREFSFVGLTTIILLVLDPRKFFSYVWFPHFFAQWGIVSMNMLQHDGCDVVPSLVREDAMDNWNGSRNFVGPLINYLTFNNGYHTIHHIHPTMHWSRLPEEHERVVKPKIHPSLDERCMARYIFRAFIYPGKRLDYRGKEVKVPTDPEPEDVDWTQDYAPDGLKPQDYQVDLSWRGIIRALPLIPFKLLSPLYSPVHKIN